MRIELYDNDRYFVTIGRGGTYLVELTAFGDNAACGCKDFQMRHQPVLQNEEDCGITHNTKRQCKHIQALVTELAKLNQPSSLNEKEGK